MSMLTGMQAIFFRRRQRVPEAHTSVTCVGIGPIDDNGVSGYRRFSWDTVAIPYTHVRPAKNRRLFGFIGPYAAHARRAFDVYAVGDLLNFFDAVQQFLEHLLQVKVWHTTA